MIFRNIFDIDIIFFGLGTSTSENLPLFNYIECKEVQSTDFEPDICIRIKFHDASDKDAILFSINEVDNIYEGLIIDTLDPIVLTGHWRGKFSQKSSYVITVNSDILDNKQRFVRHEDGSTTYVQYNKDIDNIITDDNYSSTALTSGNSNANSFQT